MTPVESLGEAKSWRERKRERERVRKREREREKEREAHFANSHKSLQWQEFVLV